MIFWRYPGSSGLSSADRLGAARWILDIMTSNGVAPPKGTIPPAIW